MGYQMVTWPMTSRDPKGQTRGFFSRPYWRSRICYSVASVCRRRLSVCNVMYKRLNGAS